MVTAEVSFSEKIPTRKAWIKKVVEVCAKKIKRISGIIEINFVSKDKIRKLNKEFRGKDAVTDVLSFSLREGELVAGPVFGELYICYEQIKKQAVEFGVDINEELARMIIHGILHLSGYDHIKKSEAKQMFALQETIITKVKRVEII